MSANAFYGTADKENHRESGGRIRRPSAKVRQTVHEQEETVHCCHRLLWEEGSENEDEDHSNEGQDIEEDGFHEEEGTHFSSQGMPTKLSAMPRQRLIQSNSKIPKAVNLPDHSAEGEMFFLGDEDAGLTMHDFSLEQPTTRHTKTKDRHVEHVSSEGVVTDCTNWSNIRAKRRHEPVEEEDQEINIVKAQKLTEHEGRPCAKDYDDITQEFVIMAIGDYHVQLCAEGPMPDHAQETVFLNESWAKASQITGVNLACTPQLAKLMSTQVHGELKTKLRPLVEVMFNFHSSQTKLAIKKNRTLAEELKEGASFAFKHRALVQDECCGFLKAPIIQKVINMMWFVNKNNEGIKHNACFKPFPLPALALVLTAIECCIDEWMTGTWMDIPFMVQDYRSRYDLHLKCLQEFDEVTKEFRVLKAICVRIAKDGHIHSGATVLAMQPQNVVSVQIIAAAIKEHQEGLTTEDESE
ncbi:hypothetical protein SCLCIDRAFT_33076 [Scleroderma citrinum Foug A]|uniref:DUF6532 domain-containing protein n=1 Tax=Scleroderma citrinum Foug A TaxID=1036808 RepID=A0A0C3D722_9AGAM|nr:hypothetical protein SCLCIDRAFT_33076 [Scleroderma citrinum Foug A]